MKRNEIVGEESRGRGMEGKDGAGRGGKQDTVKLKLGKRM